MTIIRDRLFIDKDDRKLYDKLDDEALFKKKSKREQFLFAMSVGFKNSVKVSFESRDGLFHAADLKPADEALIKAIALMASDNNFEILSNKDELFTIAEQYAHGGIRILIDKIEAMSYGSYEVPYEKDLVDAFCNLNIEASETH